MSLSNAAEDCKELVPPTEDGNEIDRLKLELATTNH